mmetsp:Transcript_7387/g.10488  ORF Transcript_7387/g.10488 Transcript_7387/m.10488 type:complete len:314 (+) Transcript_7387:144-1085(+)
MARFSRSLVIFLSLLGNATTDAFQTTKQPTKTLALTNNGSSPSFVNNAFDKNHGHSSLFDGTRLSAAASTGESLPEEQQLDTGALLKYGSSIAIQMSIITALFAGLDALIGVVGLEDGLPFPAVLALFYGFSLKSRVFNPLNNQRPNRDQAMTEEGKTQGFRDRVMPSWTPPGVTFPIMWLLVIGPIRAYTSTLIYQANGHHLCDVTILALMLHLSMGDVWNTINNVEKRYGAAVPSVLIVSALAANAAYQYYQVDEFAGSLLGGTLLWFTVASTLIADTWRLNPNPTTGQRDPLYPTIVDGEDSVTEFAWFK